MSHLILCSQSPRRKQILTDLSLNFEIRTPNIDESELDQESALEYLKRISKSKVESIHSLENNGNSSFLSSDTIVVFENKILHKPRDNEEAIQILTQLSGEKHFVHSSFCFLTSDLKMEFDYDTTEVFFKNWNSDKILEYINIYQPFDKAGSYGIQDKNGPEDKFIGSYTNVMGFPIRKFLQYSHIWQNFIED